MTFRPLAVVLLCLALFASSVTMAVARGQALAVSRGGSTFVICSGYGVTTLSLDAEGNPIGPVHPCPDCLSGIAAYIPPAAVQPLLVAQLTGQIKRVKAAPLPHLFHVLQTRARGPPVLI